jgi:hypothetical protein
MNSRQSNGKSHRKNVMRVGLWGVILLAIAAFFATAGVRSRSATSEQSPTIPANQSPAVDPEGPGMAHADTDTLDLQLD